MEEQITAFSIFTDKDKGLLAHIDLCSGKIITSDGIEVIEHAKNEPVTFRETSSRESN
jgi:hypothetical protein